VGDVFRIADDDQPAGAGVDDVVDALTQGAARSDDIERRGSWRSDNSCNSSPGSADIAL